MVISAVLGFYMTVKFGYRSLLVWGQFLTALMQTTLIFSIQITNGYLALTAMCLMELAFVSTMGSVHWFYLPEVLTDD